MAGAGGWLPRYRLPAARVAAGLGSPPRAAGLVVR